MLWLLGVYGLISLASLAAFLGIVLALPADYFSEQRQLWIDRHPVVRWIGIIAKNLVGLAIIVLGILLSLPGMPGQGLLTIVIGAMLVDFPGKQRLVVSVVNRPGVLKTLNRLRRYFGRPPLVAAAVRR